MKKASRAVSAGGFVCIAEALLDELDLSDQEPIDLATVEFAPLDLPPEEESLQ